MREEQAGRIKKYWFRYTSRALGTAGATVIALPIQRPLKRPSTDSGLSTTRLPAPPKRAGLNFFLGRI